MYIFPRQFGLHNAFTSKVDSKETTHRFKDYTLREKEILDKFGPIQGTAPTSQHPRLRVPKRLRGEATDLVIKLQRLHRKCSYIQILQHYCPVNRPRHKLPLPRHC